MKKSIEVENLSKRYSLRTGHRPALKDAFLNAWQDALRECFPTIAEFSQVTEVLDQSVKHYSSGMAMRLAIGVALHLNSDILLMDEVMEVLDREFRKKCFERLREKRREGGTVEWPVFQARCFA